MDAAGRMQREMMNMMERLNKDHIRKLQGEVFRCSARCCDDSNATLESMQKCVETCQKPREKFEEFARRENTNLQNQTFDPCARNCQAQVEEEIEKKSITNQSQATVAMDKCLDKCTDAFIKHLPGVEKKFRDYLSKHT